MTEIDFTTDYTGKVSGTSTAQRRITPTAEITKLAVGPMDNNVYLISCRETGHAILIDAANDAEKVIALGTSARHLDSIVTTHLHADHWWALAEVAAQLAVPTGASRIDAPNITSVAIDQLYDDDDQLTVGNLVLKVILLRGHTPGSIALALTDNEVTHIFSGDSLFPGGVGKTANTDDFHQLLSDVETKLFNRFPDDSIVYPGHGDDTILGKEKVALPQWRERGW